MISIGVSEFRANLNAVLQKVQNGEVIAITSRGAEVARLVPPDYAQTAARKELEHLRQTAKIGDIVAPVDVDWDAAE